MSINLRWLVVTVVLAAIASSGLVATHMALPTGAPATLQAQAWTPANMDVFWRAEIAQKLYWQAEREAARVFKRNGVTDKFAGLVAECSLEYQVRPRVLAALIVVESHGNPRAIVQAPRVLPRTIAMPPEISGCEFEFERTGKINDAGSRRNDEA